MGRKRTRPLPTRERGIARGYRQRIVLDLLLSGHVVLVPLPKDSRRDPAPAGISQASWAGFRRRLGCAGYLLQPLYESFAGSAVVSYSVKRLFPHDEKATGV